MSGQRSGAWAILFARLVLGFIFFMAGVFKVFSLTPAGHVRKFLFLLVLPRHEAASPWTPSSRCVRARSEGARLAAMSVVYADVSMVKEGGAWKFDKEFGATSHD